MERYFNTLKNECINLYEFQTEESLYQAVEEFSYVTIIMCVLIPIMATKRPLKPGVHDTRNLF